MIFSIICTIWSVILYILSIHLWGPYHKLFVGDPGDSKSFPFYFRWGSVDLYIIVPQCLWFSYSVISVRRGRFFVLTMISRSAPKCVAFVFSTWSLGTLWSIVGWASSFGEFFLDLSGLYLGYSFGYPTFCMHLFILVAVLFKFRPKHS